MPEHKRLGEEADPRRGAEIGSANARSETVATSGMFKAAFAKRRCLVPAATFYEWQSTPDRKVPYAIAALMVIRWRLPASGRAGHLPGEILRTFAILTTGELQKCDRLQQHPDERGCCEGRHSGLINVSTTDVFAVY